MKESIAKSRIIVEELFYDEHAITQWQYEMLQGVISGAEEANGHIAISAIARLFTHDVLEKIRASHTDAEARRFISLHLNQ